MGPGQALKTVYRTNLSHFHCPIPGEGCRCWGVSHAQSPLVCGVCSSREGSWPCSCLPRKSHLPTIPTEWLYESLSGQAPTPNCTLQVFDPHMGQDLALDVVFCENAKVHYITVSL